MEQCGVFRMMKRYEEDEEKDALWDLLGQVREDRVSARFVDDTVRRVRLDGAGKEGRLGGGFRLLPWAVGFVCLVLAVWLSVSRDGSGSGQKIGLEVTEHGWDEMDEVAEGEIIKAAADYLDRFSDQELVRLVGF